MLPITVNILEQGTPDDVKYILFKRLNTGGVTLKPQEIRTAMFPKSIDTLREMAESEEFLRVTQGKIPVKRQEDKDFVSRFIAFYLLGHETYKPTMDLDAFVNLSMKTLCETTDPAAIQKMKSDFKRALCIAEKIFGDDAFRKRTQRGSQRNPINKAYFEVLTTTFARLTEADEKALVERKELLIDNLIVLMRRSAFMTSISTGTGMVDRVQTRFKGVADAVKATLEGKNLE